LRHGEAEKQLRAAEWLPDQRGLDARIEDVLLMDIAVVNEAPIEAVAPVRAERRRDRRAFVTGVVTGER